MKKGRPYHLKLQGVHCVACVAKIEKTLKKNENIQEYGIDFAQKILLVYLSNSSDKTIPDIIKSIRLVGYDASIISSDQMEADNEHSHGSGEGHSSIHLFIRAFVAFIFGSCIFLLSWNISWLMPEKIQQRYLLMIVSVTSLAVLAYAGGPIFRRFFKALIHKHTTMDTLVALGAGSAWVYSTIVVFTPSFFLNYHTYFDSSFFIVAFVTFGSAIEARASRTASHALHGLLSLKPLTAHRIATDNSDASDDIGIGLEDVSVHDLNVGDTILVKSGEKIPADGVIIKGEAEVNESMLTGESVSAFKKSQNHVYAGTVVAVGTLTVSVMRRGDETMLSHIINHVRRAQSTKPPIARMADVVSSYFVPSVIVLSILTAFIWWIFGYPAGLILSTSMAVLVVACPCALGLATPISMIVGLGKASEHGILIRHGDLLQKIEKINSIVLDKTGTITQGKLEIINFLLLDENLNKEDVLTYAASLETFSEHSLAHAIANKYQYFGLKSVTSFNVFPGMGVSGIVADRSVYIGNEAFMSKNDIDYTNCSQYVRDNHRTYVYVAIDENIAGIFFMEDLIRPHAKEAIKQIRDMGIDIVMLTGGQKTSADFVAQQVGINSVVANVLPQQKSQYVQKLQTEHKVVAMVGDGINDAAALAQADVGFAIGAGSDATIDNADVVLMHSSLEGIIDTIMLAKCITRNIKQNIFGAFIYNVIAIPIAAGILYPFFGILLSPVVASIAMAISSITVVSNANRLRFFKRKVL